jgi:hypothetical protein
VQAAIAPATLFLLLLFLLLLLLLPSCFSLELL